MCVSLCGFVGVEGNNGSHCCNHSYLELIWHCSCVLFRIIISQRSDTYLKPHSGASQSTKDQIFDGYFSNSFLVLHGNKGQSLNWVCKRAAMSVPTPDSKLYSKLLVITQLFICHFLLPACVWGFHRNWCAYVVTRTVSCVMEDGVETYIKPDYQRCTWGQCPRVAWVPITLFLCVTHFLWLFFSASGICI